MSVADCLANGDRAFGCNEFEKALSFYSQALDGDSDDSLKDVYAKRGQCYFEMKNYKDALKDAEELADRTPDEVNGYILKGNCLMQMKRFEDSFVAFKKGLEVDPDNAVIANNLKHLQEKIIAQYEADDKKQTTTYDAVKLCSQEPYPGDDELETLEREIMSKWALDDLPTINPQIPDTDQSAKKSDIARRERAGGKLKEALKHITLALELEPANVKLWKERAEILYELGELKESFRTCNTVFLQQRTADIWTLGGRVLADLGLPVMAETWFRKATQLSQASSEQAALLFQKVRVGRLYGPLTSGTSAEVTFTQYGRAISCTSNICDGQIIFSDKPVVLAQTLDSHHIPACCHCATSMMRPEDVFRAEDLKKDELKKALTLFWPKRKIYPCKRCNTQRYCSEECVEEAWNRYHQILCPSENATVNRLYDICSQYTDLKVGDSRVWKGWWNASFSPFVLAKIWASITCEAKRLAADSGRTKPSSSDWSRAQASFRR